MCPGIYMMLICSCCVTFFCVWNMSLEAGNVHYCHVGTGFLPYETDCCVMLFTYCSCNWLTQIKAVDTEFFRAHCAVICQMVHEQTYCKHLTSEHCLDIRALQFWLLFCKKWAWGGADGNMVRSTGALQPGWEIDENATNALAPFSNLGDLPNRWSPNLPASKIFQSAICEFRQKGWILSHITRL